MGSSGQGKSGLRPVSAVPFQLLSQTFSSKQMQSLPQLSVHRPLTPPITCREGVFCGAEDVEDPEVEACDAEVAVVLWTELVAGPGVSIEVVEAVEMAAVSDVEEAAASASVLLVERVETPTPTPTPTPIATAKATTPRTVKKTHLFKPRILIPSLFPVPISPPDAPASPYHADPLWASVVCGRQWLGLAWW
jgi:hypothetical protein